jgi:hypothetical protein
MQKNSPSNSFTLLIVILSTYLASFGCSKVSSDDSNRNQQEVAEIDLCTTSTAYSPSATINGTATFSKRGLEVMTSPSLHFKLGSIVSNLPIKFAEVRVLNSAGRIVQCGMTNSAGALKALNGTSDLQIPATAGTYTVEVLSRANYKPTVPANKPEFSVLFSVKEDIYSNAVYKTIALVTTTGAGLYNNVNSNATAAEGISSKIEGGAFNIYNDVITTYEYLANNTGTQNISCLNPKMSAYWKAGFNPKQYISPSAAPESLDTISFYLRTDKELYISGGKIGDVAGSDTDHFDDSVIIHELGHHIENVCGSMDSPGGSHNGSARIDPRLAWSEAWGNYFGAHIIRNNTNSINPNLNAALPNNEWIYYVDTDGYSEGATIGGYEYLKFNLSSDGNTNTTETLYTRPDPNYLGSDGIGSYSFDRVNSSANPGEGHFREVAISRALFKASNTCRSNCANLTSFSSVWMAFEKFTTGMGQSIYPFRSSVRFLDRLKVAEGGSLSSGLLSIFETQEAMQLAESKDYTSGIYKTWVPYGTKLIKGGSCNLKIIPQSSGSGASDQRFSNHFYYLDPSELSGVTSITLNISASASGDLTLYSEVYSFKETRTGNTTVSISNLSSRKLLNVRAGNTSEYIYTLTDQNGGILCPSSF